jgi:hypothetical protein
MVACVITFFSSGGQRKKAMTIDCGCLLFCVKEEENNDNASSPSFVVLLEQKR